MKRNGVDSVNFKRKEGFRFTFEEALDAKYAILLDGKYESLERPMYPCDIIDISPKGMKMFSTNKIGEHTNKLLQIEVNFILYKTAIRAVGEIIWSKPYASGFQYGLEFREQQNLGNLIVEELKLLRRSEVFQKRKIFK